MQISGQDAAAGREAAAREVMRSFHQYSIPALWVAWLLYWSVAAIGAKANRRRRASPRGCRTSSRSLSALPCSPRSMCRLPGSTARFLPPAAGWFWLGLALVALGPRLQRRGTRLAWAQLERHGDAEAGSRTDPRRPYRWVRHPIYTGLLLAILGSAIALGEWRGLIALVLVTAAFLRKIAIEERFLIEHFGEAYAHYRAEVPALVPLPPERSLDDVDHQRIWLATLKRSWYRLRAIMRGGQMISRPVAGSCRTHRDAIRECAGVRARHGERRCRRGAEGHAGGGEHLHLEVAATEQAWRVHRVG